MSGKDKATKSLRKENSNLRSEIDSLKTHVMRLEERLREEQAAKGNLESSILSTEEAKTLEFVSGQCDDMMSLHDQTLKELKSITERLNSISNRCEEIKNYVDNAEDYSYQFNVKIIGMPVASANESVEETTGLCLRLFQLIGAKDISILDIDIAHRVRSRVSSNRPNPIICRFVRRLARNRVIACRKSVSNVTSNHLGFDSSISLEGLAVFEHLSPRQQSLFNEAKTFKVAHNFKFCWAKGGAVFLRKGDESHVIKIKKEEDLLSLIRMEHSPE